MWGIVIIEGPCRVLSSLLCLLHFTFQSFSQKSLEQVKPNLTEILIGWSSTLFVTFLSIGNSKWLLDQLCFLIDWNFLAKLTFVMEILRGGRYIPCKILQFVGFVSLITSFNIRSCGNMNKNKQQGWLCMNNQLRHSSYMFGEKNIRNREKNVISH